MTDFRSRLTFDEVAGEILDQTRRYMLIRPPALMGLFRRLPERERLMALEALKASIVEQGSDSARAYQALGAAEGGLLLATIAASAPQLGWGRWRFEPGAGRLDLEVTNSPFAAGFGPSTHPVCHAVAGMLEAVAGLVFGMRMTAVETACAACGAPACRFTATGTP